MISLVRKSWELVGHGRRLKWLALIALALIVTVMEAIGAALIFLLLALVTEPDATVELPVVGDLSRFAPELSHEQFMIVVAAGIAIFTIVRSGVVFAQTYIQQRVVHNAGARLATRLLRGYLATPYAFHMRRNSAELIRNSLHSAQSVISHAVVPIVRLIAEVLVIVGLTGLLVAVSPLATAMAAAVLAPAIWILMRLIHPRVKRLGRQAQQSIQDSLQTAQQSLEGFRDVRLLGREAHFGNEFSRSRRSHSTALYKRAAWAELPPVVIEGGLVLFIVLFFIANLIGDGSPGATVPILGLFAYVGMRLQPSLRKIVGAVNNMKFGTAAVDDVHADLQRLPESILDGAEETGAFADLRLEHVTFQYDESDTPAVRDVFLTVEPGQAIGICGPTGGGKSTLIDLIVGLLVPTKGRVLVNGRDIHEDVRAWQRQLGVVSQSVFLLDGTLRENIAFGLREREIDDDLVATAVRLAQLETFVASLPQGLETRVGERGVRLSGGQRQRVAIARALYHRPKVIVFDEGTSALDNETEADLIADLHELRGAHTIIMVAHRLTTVRRCDRIFVIENAAITDSGTFEELSGRHRLFASFS